MNFRQKRPPRPSRATTAARGPARPAKGCPIVGVGASAGGLEAFTQLLKHLPVDTGFGYVLVQHLDPQHASILTQLLARATGMPVREATHGTRVKANHVYTIPPNRSMTILGGVLRLQSRSPHRSAPRSIDHFFESLARDLNGRAMGVILSGSATDGTVGLEAIKAEGGLTFAQDDSARFDSMPRSAAAAGCVDHVLSPSKIAQEIAWIAKHPYVAVPLSSPPPGSAQGAPAGARGASPATAPPGAPEPDGYGKVLQLLRGHCGVDFSLYKTSTILRRMTRRTVLNRQPTLGHYAAFLRGNTGELDALYSDALINVTSFFRNPEAFASLKQRVFPRLLAARGDDAVRIWILGCSTGQEAYSIAMAFAEAAEKSPRARKLQVFATDLNEANLEKARHGLYPKNVAHEITPERLRRFFVEEEGGYRVNKSLREQVVFARHNLISDPPFSRMDLISCRNVMIYFESSLQKQALPAFHYALNPEGCLLLGASESIGEFTDLFSAVDKKHKIFARKAYVTPALQLPPWRDRSPLAGTARRRRNPTASGARSDAHRGELNAEREADRVTLNQFAPAGVLVDAGLRVVQFRGATGDYLEPPTGKASFDLLKMAREGLLLPIRAVFGRARKEKGTVRREHVSYKLNGESRLVNLEVVPLKNLREPRYLVLFEDPAKPRRPSPAAPTLPLSRKEEASRITALERDLAEARDYLQSVQEHQEAANEELQASNEEGQSANEELQSLNEELETSKEELESTNEELTTVNEEMASRNAELNQLNGDLTNLQSSAKLVVLLLGRDLTIRRFSLQAEKQFGLHTSDLGRPVGTVRHQLEITDLDALIAGVIANVRECERDVQDKSGHWYSLRVRPYLTLDNKVDGAVLVLADIHGAKKLEHELTQARDFAEAVVGTVRDPLLILDDDFRVRKVNEAFLKFFRLRMPEVLGQLLFELDRRSWKNPRLRALLQRILPRGSTFDNFEVSHQFRRIGRRTLLLNARTLSQDPGHREKILLGFQDITERKRNEEALRKAEILLSRHAGQLEELVSRRTTQLTRRSAELTAANRRLESSLLKVSQGEEAKRCHLLEAQHMQKKLRHLTHQILTAQEEERKKISRELHDEVVQTLVGINVELSALVYGNSPDMHHLKDKIARTQRLVEGSVDAVHRFARDLRPAVLDDLGLIPALHSYCEALAGRKKFKIHLTAHRAIEGLDIDKRTVLFRVAQEALTNVARHARASRVTLTITKIPGAVRMEVADNGKSFPVRKVLGAKGNKRLGLVGMRERLEMVGGCLEIESVTGRGTTVRAELPFTSSSPKS